MAETEPQSTPVHLTFDEIEWLLLVVAEYEGDDPQSDGHRSAKDVGRKLRAAQTGQ
jgi:hypothetical protein